MQQRGRVVLERYGEGVDATTTLRSWSMAKSMLHAAVGLLVDAGRLDLDAPAPVPAWSVDADDPRAAITLRHLLTMRPGLEWREVYEPGHPSDVQAMLFGGEGRRPVPDVAAFAAAKPLVAEPGSTFTYSSGTSNIVSSIVRDVVGAGDAYRSWLRAQLFDRAGMASAAPRFDAAGTWIASSYCFCTARDFAAFGQLYLDGGRDVVSPDWVETARTPTATVEETLGSPHTMHWWRLVSASHEGFHAAGYEGQHTIVVPDLDLVVVRLGQTDDTDRTELSSLLGALVDSFA